MMLVSGEHRSKVFEYAYGDRSRFAFKGRSRFAFKAYMITRRTMDIWVKEKIGW